MTDVRRYRPADRPRVRALHDRVRPPWWTDPGPPPWFDDLDRIPDHFAAFWVAADGDRLVGMVGADPS